MTTARALGDAFTGTPAMTREGRNALAKVLGCSRDGIADAPLGDLTDRRYRRVLAAAVESATEPSDVLAALGGMPLAELVPAAALIADASVDAVRCPARLFGPLRDHDSLRWSAVLALRLADVRQWIGMGPRGAAQLLGFAFERSLLGLSEQHPHESADGAAHDVAILVDYDDRSGRGSLRHALVRLTRGAHPEAVRQAASRLLRSGESVAGVADAHLAAARGEVLDELVESAGSARDQAVFVARELTVAGGPTVDELALRHRLSSERIRQLRIRAADRVLSAAAKAPEWVAQLVTELRRRIGVAAPADDVTGALAELAGDLPTATGGQLLSWLAGPYRPVRACPGWLAIEPDRLAAMTKRILNEDGGVRIAGELSDELARAGVVVAHRPGWLRACGAVFVDGMVASTAGTCGDVLERLLFAAGRPRTPDELSSLLPNGHTDEALAVVLQRDRRFVPADGDTEADAFELTEWRPATANARATARTNGTRVERAQYESAGLASVDERLWMRVVVDAALLAGTPHPAPSHLPAELGLSPGTRRTFASRYGPVSIVDDGGDATIETLRPVALASGAGNGDALALGFNPDGVLTVKLLRDEHVAAEQPQLAQGAR